ncbi:hypothetical protein BDD12DRAFT_823819 [Trichophaea hybrida]|nr:hypothetical protein BDD12DRAFT_823819 [Trichophaea hybrida]
MNRWFDQFKIAGREERHLYIQDSRTLKPDLFFVCGRFMTAGILAGRLYGMFGFGGLFLWLFGGWGLLPGMVFGVGVLPEALLYYLRSNYKG